MPQFDRQRTFGWLPDIPDHRDHLYSAPITSLGPLPPSIDLRTEFPEPYDQEYLGSCTANAIAAAVQFNLRKQGGPDLIPSRLFIYYNERVMEHSVNFDAGAYLRDGVKSVAKLGVCPEPEWPYDGNPFPDRIGDGLPPNARFAVKPTAACYASAKHCKANSYQRLPRILSQMKGCLASGYPFVYGFSVYQSFISQKVHETGIVPMPVAGEPGANEDGSPAGHAVLAVGYDDAQQVFIFRNSWGTAWGMQGYGTMPYAYLLEGNLSDDFWMINGLELA